MGSPIQVRQDQSDNKYHNEEERPNVAKKREQYEKLKREIPLRMVESSPVDCKCNPERDKLIEQINKAAEEEYNAKRPRF